jgi:lambda family phage tail tape measure protein
MFDLSSATRTAEQTLEIEKIRTQFKDSPVEAARQVAITRERQRLSATLTPTQLQDPVVQQRINRLGELAAQTEEERQNRRPAKKERGAAQRERKLDTLTAQADSARFLRRQVVDLGISFEQAERNLLVYNAQVQQGVTANSTLGKEIDRLIRAKAEDERITNELKEEYESMKGSLENIMGPLKAYQEETRNLNRLLQDGKISQQQYNDAIRRTRLAYLENQTTVEAGVERTFLKFTDSAADFAGQTENLLTTAFEGAGDVIANFARTGKLEVADLVREINAQLLKIAFNEIFTQTMGGEAGGGMFSKIFSGLTNVVLGAASGGGSTLGASSSIKGFASGGSFEVGPQTSLGNISAGADNRLVAFAARDGEVVDVRTPGQAGGMSGGGMVINVNIMTNDAESFRKSQSQVSADIARAVRAGSRNL